LLVDLFESLHVATLGYEGVQAKQMLSFFKEIFKKGELISDKNS